MHWKDEGYLLFKTNFDENSIIIEAFTLNHGKFAGVVYGGSSRKHKKNFQIGNKILLNWKSKNENKMGYFNTELIKPVSPLFFDDKKKTTCLLAASSILKILLPERQINKQIYFSFEELINKLNYEGWIESYIFWELSLIKELGFESNILDNESLKTSIDKTVEINNKHFKIPNLLFEKSGKKFTESEIKEALIFNKNLFMHNFIEPNSLRFPLSRSILEKYYN